MADSAAPADKKERGGFKSGFGGDIIFAKKVPKDLIKNKKGIYILFRPKRLKINEFLC